MSVKITYFVHGTTTDNENHISSGWKDVDISELGIKQSKELPLQNTNRFDAVFCSDLIEQYILRNYLSKISTLLSSMKD